MEHESEGREIQLTQAQMLENRIVNYLISLGYKEGLEFRFADREESAFRSRLVLPNVRLMNPKDLVETFGYAAEHCNFTMSDLKQTDRLSGYIDITTYLH